MHVDLEIVLEGFIFEKVKVEVKVTGVKGSNNVPISIKLGGWMQGRVTGSKVKVTGVKSQIIVRSPSNLVGGCRDGSRGQRLRSFLERSGVKDQIMFFHVFTLYGYRDNIASKN